MIKIENFFDLLWLPGPCEYLWVFFSKHVPAQIYFTWWSNGGFFDLRFEPYLIIKCSEQKIVRSAGELRMFVSLLTLKDSIYLNPTSDWMPPGLILGEEYKIVKLPEKITVN